MNVHNSLTSNRVKCIVFNYAVQPENFVSFTKYREKRNFY